MGESLRAMIQRYTVTGDWAIETLSVASLPGFRGEEDGDVGADVSAHSHVWLSMALREGIWPRAHPGWMQGR
jgi:hypothetical protein